MDPSSCERERDLADRGDGKSGENFGGGDGDGGKSGEGRGRGAAALVGSVELGEGCARGNGGWGALLELRAIECHD